VKKESAPLPEEEEALEDDERPEMSERTWRISAAAILLTSAFLRLYDLRLVPAHHDEGVNGNFLLGLVRNGTYQYDPHNYHGPTLYYFAAVIPWLYRFIGGTSFRDAHGLTTFNIRLVTAAFGVGTVWLALLLRKRIGTVGALSAAALIGISPGAVYFSRYFIHEMLFVFFTAGIVVAILKYYDTARPLYLALAAASAGLMTATKETWIISGPVLLIALITTEVYIWLRQRSTKKARKWKRAIIEPHGTITERSRQTLERFGGASAVATYALVAIAVFLAVNVFFYSSFFTNYPKGVRDALETLNLWSQRTHEHGHPWWQYLEWLGEEESPLLVLGGLGALVAVWRADNRFALFAAQWAFGSLAAYSLVEYKTPWIALNFIVPLAITGGYTLGILYAELRRWQQPRLFIALAVLIVAIAGYQMLSLNFVHYDDDHYAYVYAHTRRDLLAMLEEVDRVARLNGTGSDTGITISAPEYWPLPWYLRDYKHVGYFGHVTSSDDAVIIASVGQEAEVKATLGDRYQLISSGLPNSYAQRPGVAYSLRPGVDFLLYVRSNLAR
jgi:uncharacterized protein (TIGR03663 family)